MNVRGFFFCQRRICYVMCNENVRYKRSKPNKNPTIRGRLLSTYVCNLEVKYHFFLTYGNKSYTLQEEIKFLHMKLLVESYISGQLLQTIFPLRCILNPPKLYSEHTRPK